MGFELFDSRAKNTERTAPRFVPFVTVTGSHAMLVNRWAALALGNPSRVLLYFDRERRMVGMRPVEAAPHSYRASPGPTANRSRWAAWPSYASTR